MSIKASVILLVGLALASASLAAAQQPTKVLRIGYLVGGDPTTESARSEGIRLALRELGYIEVTEHRYRVPICGGEA